MLTGRGFASHGTRRDGSRPWIATGCAILLGLIAGFSTPRTASSDAEVAKFLLSQGKKSLSLRKFDDAIQKFSRAVEEDPSLIEALYLLGQVHEKKKDPARALSAYRKFRDACREQKRAGSLDKKVARFCARAEKRITVLGRGETELERLQKSFGVRIWEFAKRVREEDPDIAVEALRRLLIVYPQDEAAQRFLSDMTGEGELELTDGPLKPTSTYLRGIRLWDDMLDRHAIAPGKKTKYVKGVLTIENRDGTVHWADGPTRAPSKFVYELDFRVTKDFAAGWLVGLTFGQDEQVTSSGGNEFVSAFIRRSTIHLVHASGGANIDVAERPIEPKRFGTWRRLAVAVQGRKVRVYLDGKSVLNSSVPGRKTLAGPVGLFHQRCVAEIRYYRLGRSK